MRILTIAVLVGSAVLAANPLSKDDSKTSHTNLGSGSVVASGDVVDPIITGQTISKEDISEWEQERKRYLECPNCAAKQEFPGD